MPATKESTVLPPQGMGAGAAVRATGSGAREPQREVQKLILNAPSKPLLHPNAVSHLLLASVHPPHRGVRRLDETQGSEGQVPPSLKTTHPFRAQPPTDGFPYSLLTTVST